MTSPQGYLGYKKTLFAWTNVSLERLYNWTFRLEGQNEATNIYKTLR